MDNQQPSLETERFNDHPNKGVECKLLALEVAHTRKGEDMICTIWKHIAVGRRS